tara:strand:+ start:371 stop:637 length:267 start_codon:yes stop_codon:yes gene_type:complete
MGFVLGILCHVPFSLLCSRRIPFQQGDTPLILASWKGHVEVLKELLKSGASASHQNKVGVGNLINTFHTFPFLFSANGESHSRKVTIF